VAYIRQWRIKPSAGSTVPRAVQAERNAVRIQADAASIRRNRREKLYLRWNDDALSHLSRTRTG
jgi:hypothetical protein